MAPTGCAVQNSHTFGDLLRMLFCPGFANADAFVVVAHHLFEALSNPQDPMNAPEKIPWGLVLQKHSLQLDGAVHLSVDELLRRNILTYDVDREHVRFHSRVLKWVYLQQRKDAQVVRAFEDSLAKKGYWN